MPPRRGFAKPKNAKGTIKRIIGYMGKFKALWLLVLLCVLISSLTGVVGAYLIKPALNNYIIPMIGSGNPDFSGFARLLVGVLAMFLLGTIASYCNSRLMLYISTNLLFNIRCELFSKLEKLPIKFYDAHTHGDARRTEIQRQDLPADSTEGRQIGKLNNARDDGEEDHRRDHHLQGVQIHRLDGRQQVGAQGGVE